MSEIVNVSRHFIMFGCYDVYHAHVKETTCSPHVLAVYKCIYTEFLYTKYSARKSSAQ